jgi:hypothetical protein
LCPQTYNNRKHRMKRSLLKLHGPNVGPAPTPPGPTRVRAVTVHHFDGRAPPTTYGVAVPPEATLQQVMDAAAPLAGGLHAGEHFVAAAHGERSITRWLSPTDKVTDRDASSSMARIALYRVPKPAKSRVTDPQYAAVRLLRPAAATEEGMPLPRDLGLPLLLPLTPAHANGGAKARAAVAAAVITAVRPFLSATAAVAPPVTAASLSLWRSSGYNHSVREFLHTSAYNSYIGGERCFTEGRLGMAVHFTAPQLQALGIEEALLAPPVVHSTAAPEALARESASPHFCELATSVCAPAGWRCRGLARCPPPPPQPLTCLPELRRSHPGVHVRPEQALGEGGQGQGSALRVRTPPRPAPRQPPAPAPIRRRRPCPAPLRSPPCPLALPATLLPAAECSRSSTLPPPPPTPPPPSRPAPPT